MSKRISIVSDGTVFGTKVLVDGEPLAGVQRASFDVSVDAKPQVYLELADVDVIFESVMEQVDDV